MQEDYRRMYICVLDEFPDYMTPTLVAHSVLGAHLEFSGLREYDEWLNHSFRKCVVRVNEKEFQKIRNRFNVYEGKENNTLDGRISCLIPLPRLVSETPNVLKFAKLWKPS